ncbi:MAG TPA: bifunctional diaminohydroxyphosphoribosylaminopyrimidine deaminase/5-amino-6-(5-phosphoribosylamino)uracil reductase RibD [Aquabacterium sp.]|uniref:bifunctional diaminohydroxyphosphoribosylaminopyrimidine deaminase/5-amino-6-(5-phosphoribosylamino)uracil reductase RibD n=1 Tax=Aquabacterium sp. TaxID=1872578 RepID=UPI002E33B62B|nr:bifunctional diaminohydroxyphosphoribosylaminopyrimidine deaminase/5-amino-6-(5-phosphoribosylamino)uracil reductase RibD [Aquabacterium sp.]HEX5371780.1 bifunctional diaminohydroxyphosphoribosylaminopyrimidine deaminase/5-amino-6-(5-phosphoribosylamino)uracil reductase RibD [Aquabacterium sp.]
MRAQETGEGVDRWPEALALARRAIALSEPNPRVGCVITSPQGELIGQGHTQQAGGPHAEVMALRDAQARGRSVQGATAWVTLEPCAHFGRTPPCADALVKAQVARVMVALADPNPLVAGQGVARLRAAGIAVDVLPTDHPAAVEARELNIGFLSRMSRQRPWVRVKMAASLDGRTALPDGQSQWITGEAARADGHAWRARATAVLTGIGTVLADNPRMDVRALSVARQPWRVVLDSHWRLPLDAALLGQTPGDVLVLGLAEQAPERQAALAQAGVQVVPLAADAAGRHPDLAQVLAELARRGVNELHVEAGAALTGSLIQEGWADELLVYLAPKLLGPGRALADLAVLPSLAQAPEFVWREVAMVGGDVRLLARRPGADHF